MDRYTDNSSFGPFSIFEQMPDVIFFVKNADRQFEQANPTFARLCGASSAKEIHGCMSNEFFSAEVATIYDDWDINLLHSRRTMLSQLHQTKNARGETKWLFGTRMVYRDVNEQSLKIVSHSRLMPRFRNSDRIYNRIKIATDRFADFSLAAPSLSELASLANCSESQIGRDFIQFLGLSPRAYLNELRIQRAKDLIFSGMDLANIAIESGFSDQSSLTRSFKKSVGMTPRAFANSRN